MKFFKSLLAAFIGALVAFGFLMLIMFGILGGMIASLMPGEDPISVSPNSVLKIDLSTTLGEQTVTEPLDLSGIMPYSSTSSYLGILDAVQAIEYAATDPAIKYIYITGCAGSNGAAYIEELRAALANFRNSGKPVIAYGRNFSLTGYWLASASDKIYADEMASNSLTGISTTIVFLKDILDKYGVKMQLIRHGKYKSAGEQYIANNISQANRDQNQAMVDALWNTIAGDICQSRSLDLADFNRMVDGLSINTAYDMLELGLIDGIRTDDGINEELKNLSQVEDIKDVKIITLDKYAKARLKTNYRVKEKIAIIYADGQINDSGEGITTASLLPAIREVRRDSSVKAVVLRVNSPGGSVQPAEIIRTELELLQQDKPLIVSYGTLAASGGYWISAGADKIYSNNTTLTGSIGVFSMIPCIEKTLKEQIHVNPVTIRSHRHADMYSIMRPLDTRETEAIQGQIELIYDRFLSIVSEGRGLTTEQVDAIAQGRVWCGSEALDIRLVNEIGGLKDALDYAAISANLENYRIVSYPAVKTGLDKFMENLNQTEAAISRINNPEEILDYLFESLKAEQGTYALMPYIYYFE